MANTTKQKTAPKAVKGLGERVKIGEEIFTKQSCHNSKESAKEAAKALKATHRTAIRKDKLTGKECVLAKKK